MLMEYNPNTQGMFLGMTEECYKDMLKFCYKTKNKNTTRFQVVKMINDAVSIPRKEGNVMPPLQIRSTRSFLKFSFLFISLSQFLYCCFVYSKIMQ